jgi:magnesium-protoporphyrin O-methyltransferase
MISKPTAGIEQPTTIDLKTQLRSYFDGAGFARWTAIYGDAPLSRIRATIRRGHARMLAQAAAWIDEAALPATTRALDAGCGTGLFSIALARRGWHVTAIDFAPQMIAAAQREAVAAGVSERIAFRTDDLEALGDRFDLAVCFDVLIHYPPSGFAPLCAALARSTHGPLLLTYAPYNPLLAALHWIGGRFPHANRRTAIQMTPDRDVDRVLIQNGMRIARRARISDGFYHVTLVEARPVA